MRALCVSLALAALTACAPGDFTYDKRIDGPYHVLAIDDIESMRVCYYVGRGGCSGRVAPNVYSVGWDERYIVAARRPQPDAPAEYFYIDRIADGPNSEASAVHGPFDEASFERERARLSLPEFMRDVPFIYGGDSPRRGRFEDIFK